MQFVNEVNFENNTLQVSNMTVRTKICNEVSIALLKKIQVFWYIAPCRLQYIYRSYVPPSSQFKVTFFYLICSIFQWNHMCDKRNKENGVVFIIRSLHAMVTSQNNSVSVKEKGRNKQTHSLPIFISSPDLQENLPAVPNLVYYLTP